MKFAIFTLGCKTNQYESEQMRESLLKSGFTEVDFKDFADLYVVNSCVVTEKAERETRKAIYEARRRNPKARIILTGCYTNLHRENTLGQIDFYKGSKSKIGEYVKTGLVENDFDSSSIETFFERARAFIKVEEGCNNFCAYCIVPIVRGHTIRSKPKEKVVEEAKNLVKNGYMEIVLTGTEIGKYGEDIGTNIAELVHDLKRIEGLRRLRISSIHPKHVDSALINEFREPFALQPHLHISLQSGDNGVLEKMDRGYTVEDFLSIVAKLREIDPLFSISTDIIVGFPGESEEAFINSLAIVHKVGFSKVHVFRYSRRPFTKAFYFKESVPEYVKSVRSERLREFASAIQLEYKKNFLGKVVEVLVEEEDGNTYFGFTPHYLRVSFSGVAKVNSIARVLIEDVNADLMFGRLISTD